jgi:hypothetical protein
MTRTEYHHYQSILYLQFRFKHQHSVHADCLFSITWNKRSLWCYRGINYVREEMSFHY